MTEREAPRCPWCGESMYLWDGLWACYYICKKCESRTPRILVQESDYCRITDSEAKRRAYAAAMKRAEPMLKPLTLKEVLMLPDVIYTENRFGDIEPKIPYSIDNLFDSNKTYINFTDESLITLSDYNKTWRCWLRKPTDEERVNAAWEETK